MKKIKHVFHPGRSMGNFVQVLQNLLAKAEQSIMITIEEYKPPKSRAQNAYFHAVVVPTIAKELGKPVYVIRESLKLAFLPCEPSLLDPQKWYPKSLANISRPDYTAFIEECLAWAAGEGIYIPDPDEHKQAA